MILLTPELRAKLRTNNQDRDADHVPVVKFFTPWGGATWIIKDMEPDGDTMFGLCDLGLGEPELGYVSLRELDDIRGPRRLRVERDLHFRPTRPLSEYVIAARAARRIVEI